MKISGNEGQAKVVTPVNQPVKMSLLQKASRAGVDAEVLLHVTNKKIVIKHYDRPKK